MNDKYEMGNYFHILDIAQYPGNRGNELNQTAVIFNVYNDYFQLIKYEGLQAVVFETFIDKQQMYEIEFDNEGEEAKWLMMLS